MALSVSNAAPSGTPDAASRETPSMGSPPADALAHNVDSAETHTIHPPEKDPHTEAAVATHVAVPVAEPEARRGGARDPPEEKPLGERSASEDGKADCFSTGVVQDRTTWQADSPPIHLYSGIDCSLLASYSCYNHLDEVAHAYSLLFHPTKPRLFAGGISGVRIFDLERPGRQVKDILFATRRAKQGQKGIISCMDFKQVGPGANQLFACGSYSPSVCVYTEEGGGRRSGVPYTTPTHCLLDKATSWGGVTQVKFVGEHLLVAGHRQDGTMRCWDLRRPSSPLSRLARETTQSSQKFAFDTCSFTDEDEGEITALVTDGSTISLRRPPAVLRSRQPLQMCRTMKPKNFVVKTHH
ncbi:hypothetical protein NCLIV_067270 [Neospora caninum Liverpool]|uniref:WD domain, G-beta repeat-containing protein n=1 Tax=Neospora caninum (strain Liverpool) TaxID=572307 RepID=F0VRF4_NEOCL|nr:hypothetical protein NCLIV_067270 [Neospora caninum Liverpool]CBZ56302.1 hypothetical protein NCLIV_067270 [Neospora caninum Liverpool]|eukprot:XP_003886327.1 hypothetical protein NCLIV_067270 [Neospora caninum Liverpool]